MNDIINAIKMMLQIVGLFTLLGIGACGDGSTPIDVGGNQTGYSQEQLKPWRTLCIDNNMTRVDELHLDCLSLTPDLHCDESKSLNIEKLNNAWDLAQSLADVDLITCKGDDRVTDDFCYSTYERDLSYYVEIHCLGAL